MRYDRENVTDVKGLVERMNRREFIEGLRRALAGKVEVELIDDTVRYYEDYFDTQIRMGKSEQEVLDALGNPALIAKSIVSANRQDDMVGERTKEIYEEEEHRRYSRSRFGDKGVQFIMKMPGWLVTLLVVILVLGLISLFFSVLSFLAPVFVPIFIVVFVIKMLGKK